MPPFPQGGGGREGVRLPVGLVGREMEKLAADCAELLDVRIAAGKTEPDTPGRDGYTGGDFQKSQADRRHLSSGKPRRGKHSSPEGLDQDIRKA